MHFARFGNMACAYSGRDIRSPRGSFRQGEMLAFQQNGYWRFLKAELFIEFLSFAGESHLLVVRYLLAPAYDFVYKIDEARPTFWHLGACQMHCPYMDLGDNLIQIITPLAY